jgi:hypothetical protein
VARQWVGGWPNVVRTLIMEGKNILKKSDIPRYEKSICVKIKKTISAVARRISQKHTGNTARLKFISTNTGCLCIA